ncbi:MAG: hypothetical protein OSJ46_00655 [Duncaniella sp.]|nr:hypothetical protein [Duncaniella sp.]
MKMEFRIFRFVEVDVVGEFFEDKKMSAAEVPPLHQKPRHHCRGSDVV